MEWVLSWVKSGLLFGIFASVILMLSPNKSYQKHIDMVVGMLFILVMLHPIMVLLEVDQDTYVSYIRNFLMIESSESSLSQENVPLYESSIESQLTAVFIERGYPVKTIRVNSDRQGKVKEIAIVFSDEIEGLEVIEKYLKRLFGEEVGIRYERG